MEGFARNRFNLKHFVELNHPDFIFLSEPQIFANDLDLAIRVLSSEYYSSLNSEDMIDPELPLIKSKAKGGTMILWQQKLDPYVTVFPVPSAAFLPIIFHPPELTPSIHVSVYLPTLGKELHFLEELSKLSIAMDDLSSAYPVAPVYLRGDFNVNQTNPKRNALLKHFCHTHALHDL